MAEPLVFQATLADLPALSFGLQPLEQVRLILSGESVIDWRKMAFTRHSEVDDFLRVSGFEPYDPVDVAQIQSVHARALDYLTRTFDEKPHDGVAEPDDIRDLFLLASQPGPAQRDACRMLKVMHVIHHVDGRELLFRMPVALSDLFHKVEQRVFGAIDGMKAAGVRVVEFAGSRKTQDSILTKLLARRDSLAAEVHDKLRFRIVTEDLGDTCAALSHMAAQLFPFNYVVPGAARNDLIDFRRTVEGDPAFAALKSLLQFPIDREEIKDRNQANIFSAKGFKMINFVVDLPVRVDDLIPHIPDYRPEFGRIVFTLVEFQLMDRVTDEENASGDNRHSLYKARQHKRVHERLEGTSED